MAQYKDISKWDKHIRYNMLNRSYLQYYLVYPNLGFLDTVMEFFESSIQFI